MHISITGDLGSGKSTVAKEICKILQYHYLSTGLIQRQLALEKGMNTLEFNKYTDENKEIDDYIDQKLKDVNNQNEPYVLDSRLGWHFVRTSFKIYLMAADEIAALRVLKDEKRIGESKTTDIQAKIVEQRQRRDSENERFAKTYGIRPSIFKDFDLIIDSSTANIQEVTDLVIKTYQEHLKQLKYQKIWLSPRRIIPTFSKQKDSALNNPFLAEAQNQVVSCLLYQKEFYLFSGLALLNKAVNDNNPFLPVTIKAKNEETLDNNKTIRQYIKENLDVDALNKWQLDHAFTFFHVPDINAL